MFVNFRLYAMDGVVLFTLAMLFLTVVLLRLLRGQRGSHAALLFGIVAVGAGFRFWLSKNAPMESWPYSRQIPLTELIWNGPVITYVKQRMFLTDMFYWTNTVISILTPIAVYVHTRYLMKTPALSLIAAGIVAVYPNHIRFSRSEINFVMLVALSSFCFTVVHVAVSETSRTLRWVAMAALPFVAIGTFAVRPLACVLAPMLMATAWFFSEGAPKARRIVAIVAVVFAGAWDVKYHLLAQWGNQVEDGLKLQTVIDGVLSIFSNKNTLFQFSITPIGFLILSILGFMAFIRKGDWIRAFFLLGWLFAFYVTLGFVIAPTLPMQSRYHLHLMEPFVQLTAVGAYALWEWRRKLGWAVGAYAVAVPVIHMKHITDTDFSQMHEYAFLEHMRTKVPEGCTILEFTDPEGVQSVAFDPASRVERFADFRENGEKKQLWKIVRTGGREDTPSKVKPEANELLKSPPACLMLYEGMACWTEKPFSSPIAPACAELKERLLLTAVDSVTVKNRVYNDAWSRGIINDDTKLSLDGNYRPMSMAEMTFTMFRVDGVKPSTNAVKAGEP
jgi:hypothetical protein